MTKSYVWVWAFLTVAPSAWACSESSVKDFEVPQNVWSVCAETAKKYALGFAENMVKIEKSDKGYLGPVGGWSHEKSAPPLYVTKNRSGNSQLIGYNVGLTAKNHWQCNFCVDFALDGQKCRIEAVRKHMCAR
ncbi:MAG: hypothetical protein JNL01_01745 [Bdellovibrionales bacterium]|nr:hypothetical protein [Bdellovibrionales bacterium]